MVERVIAVGGWLHGQAVEITRKESQHLLTMVTQTGHDGKRAFYIFEEYRRSAMVWPKGSDGKPLKPDTPVIVLNKLSSSVATRLFFEMADLDEWYMG